MRREQICFEAHPILLIKKRCRRGCDSHSRGSFVWISMTRARRYSYGQRGIKRRALGSGRRSRPRNKREEKRMQQGRKGEAARRMIIPVGSGIRLHHFRQPLFIAACKSPWNATTATFRSSTRPRLVPTPRSFLPRARRCRNLATTVTSSSLYRYLSSRRRDINRQDCSGELGTGKAHLPRWKNGYGLKEVRGEGFQSARGKRTGVREIADRSACKRFLASD